MSKTHGAERSWRRKTRRPRTCPFCRPWFELCEGRLLLSAGEFSDVETATADPATVELRLMSVEAAATERMIGLSDAFDQAEVASRAQTVHAAVQGLDRSDHLGILQYRYSPHDQSYALLQYEPAEASFVSELDWDVATSPANGSPGLFSASATAADGSTSHFIYRPAADDPILILPRVPAGTSISTNLLGSTPATTPRTPLTAPLGSALSIAGGLAELSFRLPSSVPSDPFAAPSELTPLLSTAELDPGREGRWEELSSTLWAPTLGTALTESLLAGQAAQRGISGLLVDDVSAFLSSLVGTRPNELAVRSWLTDRQTETEDQIFGVVAWMAGEEDTVSEPQPSERLSNEEQLALRSEDLSASSEDLYFARHQLEAVVGDGEAPRVLVRDDVQPLRAAGSEMIDVGLVWDAPIDAKASVGQTTGEPLQVSDAAHPVEPKAASETANAQQSVLPFELAVIAGSERGLRLSDGWRRDVSAKRTAEAAASQLSGLRQVQRVVAKVPWDVETVISCEPAGAAIDWVALASLAALAVPLLVRAQRSSDDEEQAVISSSSLPSQSRRKSK